MRKLFALAMLALMLVVCVAPVLAIDLPIPDCSPENCDEVPPPSGSCHVAVTMYCLTEWGPCVPVLVFWCD